MFVKLMSQIEFIIFLFTVAFSFSIPLVVSLIHPFYHLQSPPDTTIKKIILRGQSDHVISLLKIFLMISFTYSSGAALLQEGIHRLYHPMPALLSSHNITTLPHAQHRLSFSSVIYPFPHHHAFLSI